MLDEVRAAYEEEARALQCAILETERTANVLRRRLEWLNDALTRERVRKQFLDQTRGKIT